MGKETGFLEYAREETPHRPVKERIHDWQEVIEVPPLEKVRNQAARCMDCGIPFCNNSCPLGNVIPDWNDLMYRDKMREALVRLHSTNNFPEFTGRVCPAPCESACTLAINEDPVSIKQIEWTLVRHGWEQGWIEPVKPERRTGHTVAVVGSGPGGLAAAQQLGRAGHSVTIFEKNERVGGLLQFGIPEFKLEKWIVDRRVQQLVDEGVELKTGVEVGVDLSVSDLRERFDAVVLCMGSEKPRDLPIDGREFSGIHFAMEYLTQQNRRSNGLTISGSDILATDKHVIVLGGGDTGSDCVGTAHRQGAKSVTSIELLDRPPVARSLQTPWPQWPLMFRTSSSHEEGGRREYTVLTQRFVGSEGRVKKLDAVRVDLSKSGEPGHPRMREIERSEFSLPADLVLLAMGFVHPVHENLVTDLGVKLDPRGNIAANTQDFTTSEPGVFAAGDCRRGQSLVVWATWEGREAARAVDAYLMGHSRLQSRHEFV